MHISVDLRSNMACYLICFFAQEHKRHFKRKQSGVTIELQSSLIIVTPFCSKVADVDRFDWK